MQGLLAGLRLQSGLWNFGVFEDLDVVVEVLDHVAYGNIFGASAAVFNYMSGYSIWKLLITTRMDLRRWRITSFLQ